MRRYYHIKIALFKRSRSYMCSTRDWSDWCSTRLCIAEGLQKLYHGRRTPGFSRGAPGFIFLRAKPLSPSFPGAIPFCAYSETQIQKWHYGLCHFLGAVLWTQLWASEHKIRIFLFTLHLHSLVWCVFCWRKSWYPGALPRVSFYGCLLGKQHLVLFSMVENLSGTAMLIRGWQGSSIWKQNIAFWLVGWLVGFAVTILETEM